MEAKVGATPGTAAEVGAPPGTAARVGPTLGPRASLEATVEPGGKIIPRAAHKMYTLDPLMSLHPEEGKPSGTRKWKQALRQTPKAALQSPLSLTWRNGWNGRPISWAHLLDGQNSKLFQA